MALIIQIKNIKYTLFYQFTNTSKQRKGPFWEVSKAYSKDMLYFTAKGYVYFTAKVWQITKSCETAEL